MISRMFGQGQEQESSDSYMVARTVDRPGFNDVASSNIWLQLADIENLTDSNMAVSKFLNLLSSVFRPEWGTLIKEDPSSGGRSIQLYFASPNYELQQKIPRDLRTSLERLSHDLRPDPSELVVQAGKLSTKFNIHHLSGSQSNPQREEAIYSGVSFRISLNSVVHFIDLYYSNEQYRLVSAWVGLGYGLIHHFENSIQRNADHEQRVREALSRTANNNMLDRLAEWLVDWSQNLSEAITSTSEITSTSDRFTDKFLQMIDERVGADAVAVSIRSKDGSFPFALTRGINRKNFLSAMSTLEGSEYGILDRLPVAGLRLKMPKVSVGGSEDSNLGGWWFMSPGTSNQGQLIVSVNDSQMNPLNSEDKTVIRLLSSTLLASMNAGDLVSNSANELRAIGRFLSRLTRGESIDEILTACLEEVKQYFPSDFITLLTLEDDYLKVEYAIGEGAEQVKGMRFPSYKGVTGNAVQKRDTVNLRDVTEHPDYIEFYPKIKSEIAVPILAGEPIEVLGVLDIESRGIARFDQNDVEIANRIASQTALALRRAKARAERDEINDRFHSQSRLIVAGELSSGISHDANKVVGAVSASLDLIKQNIERVRESRSGRPTISQNKELAWEFQNVEKSLEKLSGLLTSLKTFGDLSRTKREMANIKPIVLSLVDIFRSKARRSNTKFRINIPPDIQGYVDPNHLTFCLWNMIDNSLDSDARLITILASTHSTEEGKTVTRIYLDDNGKGIPKEILPRLFERYASSKKEGTGLGLYFSNKIVTENNNGRIELLRSVPWKSTKFFVELPARVEDDA